MSTTDPSSSRPCPLYDAGCYDASTSVGHQLVQLVTLMRREVELRMAAHGLTDAQWKPLWMLKDGRARNAIEMARLMDVDAGAVTRLLDRLETKGLIERLRSASDRRVVHLRLTPAGEAVAAQVPHVLASVNNAFLRGFSEADFSHMHRLLGQMTVNGNALLAQREAA